MLFVVKTSSTVGRLLSTFFWVSARIRKDSWLTSGHNSLLQQAVVALQRKLLLAEATTQRMISPPKPFMTVGQSPTLEFTLGLLWRLCEVPPTLLWRLLKYAIALFMTGLSILGH
jgi:hypothetical protein